MKAKNFGAGISLVGASLFILLFTSALPAPAAAQLLSTSQPHFPPAERPLLDQIPARGIGRNFELIEHNPLVNPGQTLPRGGNGNDLAIVRNCLYSQPSEFDQDTLIVDISNPRRTAVTGSMPPPPAPPSGNTRSADELSAIESENLLVRQAWNDAPPFDGNMIEIFDTTNCFNPVLVSTIPLPDVPHEHFIWQGGDPNRILLYVTFSSMNRAAPFPPPPADIDLRVYDITDKRNPRGPIALWSLQRFGVPYAEAPDLLRNAGHGQSNGLHGLGVSVDGTRAYLASRWAGFYILDSSPLGRNELCDPEPNTVATVDNPFGVNPDACLKKLHPDPNARFDYHPPFSQSQTHSAAKVPGRPYVVLNDEPRGNNCPFSWVRIVNVDDSFGFNVATSDRGVPIAPAGTKYRGDLFPQQEGAFKIPETILERCPATREKFPGATFNAHKSLVFENLIFVSWTAGGVRAIDISNPGTPFETGFFFNKPVRQTQRGQINPQLGIRNHPVLKDGLLYFQDGASGLYILKYTGPRREEIPQEGLFTQQQIQVPGRHP